MRIARTLLLSSVVAGAAACGTTDAPPSTGPQLSDVTTPESFAFATTRSVRVGLTADDAVFGAAKDATLEVSDTDGAVMFRGALRKGKTLELKLPMGVHLDSVNARVGSPTGAKFYNFPIDAQTQSIDGQIR